jgi:putative restriction endonuclease
MRLFVAVTDSEWFGLHASKSHVDEVNFWRPSPDAPFKALQPAELLLFKLHSPDNFIVGGGFFTKFLQLPVNLAWDTFREANGVRSLKEMRDRIAHYRRIPIAPGENPRVGCIMLAEPFFWPRDIWILSPPDFKLNTVQGKGYDSETGVGRSIWEAVSERLVLFKPASLEPGTAALAAIESNGFGKPQIVLPRLGQGLFRVLLTDSYDRRCSISGERTLPVLEAAHIKPYSVVQRHEVSNGLLMRSDLHHLFDDGYMTLDPHDTPEACEVFDQFDTVLLNCNRMDTAPGLWNFVRGLPSELCGVPEQDASEVDVAANRVRLKLATSRNVRKPAFLSCTFSRRTCSRGPPI